MKQKLASLKSTCFFTRGDEISATTVQHGCSLMLMSADLAAPIVTHAALVDVPREPGSDQPGTAIGTIVNSFASHASSHSVFGMKPGNPRPWRFYNELRLRRRQNLGLNSIFSRRVPQCDQAISLNAAETPVNAKLIETFERPRPASGILVQWHCYWAKEGRSCTILLTQFRGALCGRSRRHQKVGASNLY